MNSNQLISNDEALRLFFNDDIYLVDEPNGTERVKDVDSTEIPLAKSSVTESTTLTSNNIAEPAIPSIVNEPVTKYQPVINFKHLGKNEKEILILVNDSQNPVSTPQGTELLRKLVLSINLKNADFALVNYAAYSEATFEQLKAFFACKLVLSFGVSPTSLGLADQPLHQANTLEDIKMIFTHNLHDLESDNTSKKILWGTLKNL